MKSKFLKFGVILLIIMSIGVLFACDISNKANSQVDDGIADLSEYKNAFIYRDGSNYIPRVTTEVKIKDLTSQQIIKLVGESNYESAKDSELPVIFDGTLSIIGDSKTSALLNNYSINIAEESKIPTTAKITFFQGHNKLLKGELLVDKWLYNALVAVKNFKSDDRINLSTTEIENRLNENDSVKKYVFFGKNFLSDNLAGNAARTQGLELIYLAALCDYGYINLDFMPIDIQISDKNTISAGTDAVTAKIVGYYETEDSVNLLNEKISMDTLYDNGEAFKNLAAYNYLNNCWSTCYSAEVRQ